jgi:hypothetical protein
MDTLKRKTLIETLAVLITVTGVSFLISIPVLGQLNPHPSIFKEAPYNRSHRQRPKRKPKYRPKRKPNAQLRKRPPNKVPAQLPSYDFRAPIPNKRSPNSAPANLPSYDFRAPTR